MSNKEHEKLARECRQRLEEGVIPVALVDEERADIEKHILAAIEKAVQQYDEEVSGHVVGMIDRIHKAAQPQRSEPPYDPEHPEDVYCMAEKWDAEHKLREWTPETVGIIADNCDEHQSPMRAIADAHNAALGVEREKYMSARRSSDMGWERADKYAKALEWLRSVIRHNVDGKTVQLWLDGIDSTLAKAKEHK